MPVVNATVVTEMQALRILGGVKATQVASSGVGGCEGAVALVVEGTDEKESKERGQYWWRSNEAGTNLPQ